MGLGLYGKQALGNAQQAFTQIGQLHRTLVAVKQQYAEAFLQFAHLIGDGRLGQEQPFGGTGEAAMQGNGVKSFQLSMGNRHRSTCYKLSLFVKYDKSILFISQ
ncbi:hypothetical protein D3C76_966000 [compost metagenome]